MLASRGQGLDDVQAFPGLAGVDPWALDTERRALIQEVEQLRHRQRVAGEEIARRGKAKEDASDLKAEMKGVADRIKAGDARLEEVKAAIERFLLVVPNVPDASVPVGKGRLGQRRGAAGRRAARLRLRAEVALGPRARARHPRLRARGPDLRGALHRLLGPGGAPRAGAHPVHAGPARLAGLPGDHPALPRHRGHAHRDRPAAQVRGRPLQDDRRRPRPLPDPDRRGPAHHPPPRRDPRRRGSSRRSTSPSRPASARRRARTARTCAASSASTSSTRWSSSSSPPPSRRWTSSRGWWRTPRRS